MALEWKGAPGNVIAHGTKGLYTIQSLATGDHILQSVDNADSPMWEELGFFGKPFANLEAAKAYAEEIDER